MTIRHFCQVQLAGDTHWYGGRLVLLPSGVAILFCREQLRLPADVDTIRVFGTCPVELLDAAIDSGFYVKGQPKVRK